MRPPRSPALLCQSTADGLPIKPSTQGYIQNAEPITSEKDMREASVKDAVDQFRKKKNGQVVLVLQGGGALGAYQVGVYQALHEAGVEPDWIIGTSIGAINAALIAGNRPEDRHARLEEFWRRVKSPQGLLPQLSGVSEVWSYWSTLLGGISGFFKPNPLAFWSVHFPKSRRAALTSRT